MMDTSQLVYVVRELNEVLFQTDDPERIDPDTSGHWRLRRWIREVIPLLMEDDELTPQCTRLLQEGFGYNHPDDAQGEYPDEEDVVEDELGDDVHISDQDTDDTYNKNNISEGKSEQYTPVKGEWDELINRPWPGEGWTPDDDEPVKPRFKRGKQKEGIDIHPDEDNGVQPVKTSKNSEPDPFSDDALVRRYPWYDPARRHKYFFVNGIPQQPMKFDGDRTAGRPSDSPIVSG